MPTPSPDSVRTSVADAAECGAMLRGGSHTFFAASLVLPRSMREPATALYAFCRMADDAIDRGEDRAIALIELRRRLEQIYRGVPEHWACDRAFAETVAQFQIPKSLPLALLEGFAWDAQSRQYETLTQVIDYSVRVAGTVGIMMAMLMGAREATSLARAADLGVAMQLTNIARDVGEDARAGRIYLPLEWLREAGIDPPVWLAKPVHSAELAGVIARLLAVADSLYRRSESGLAQLPRACRPAMYAARLLYAEIGKEVTRRRCDSISRRAVVSWPRKIGLLGRAGAAAILCRASSSDWGVMPEAAFLLPSDDARATAMTGLPGVRLERFRWPRLERRVIWLLNLFERLERLDRGVMVTR